MNAAPPPSRKMCEGGPGVHFIYLNQYNLNLFIILIGFTTYRNNCRFDHSEVDMRHIQYQGEMLPPSPLPLAFHLVLGKFHIYLQPNNV